MEFLDKSLSNFAEVTAKTIGHDYRNIAGTGAAGGISFALKSFLNAGLIGGFDLIADISNLENKIKDNDFVITTEGRLDSQTFAGKAPFLVAQLAKKYNIPTIIIAGSVEKGLHLENSPIDYTFSMTNDTISQEDSIKKAQYFLKITATQAINLINLKNLK